MFQDETEWCPGDHFTLGKYLGLIIDVGPAMTAKILAQNGQVLHRSTYGVLIQDEWGSEESKIELRFFWSQLTRCFVLRV